MPFNSSLVLNGGLGAIWDKVWLPAVNGPSGSGTAWEMVANASPTRTLSGATTGSDSDGDYIEITSEADFCRVAETLDPSGTGSLLIVWKPVSIGTWGTFRNIAGLMNASLDPGALFSYGYSNSTEMTLYVASSGHGPFTGSFSNLTDDVLTANIITQAAGNGGVLYQGGETSITGVDPGTQQSGAATHMGIGLIPNFGAVTVKVYCVAYVGSIVNATDAQTIVDDPLTAMFGGGGGGVSIPVILNHLRQQGIS